MTWWGQGIANATISVDTFLVMGGTLVCYLLLKELDRNKGRFNVFLFYLHRYIRYVLTIKLKLIAKYENWLNLMFCLSRLTIVYALVLGFIATLIVYMGTGPNWYNVIATSAGCRVSWWKNFLYSWVDNLLLNYWVLKTNLMDIFIVNNLFPSDSDDLSALVI